jgi:hypothetical protein
VCSSDLPAQNVPGIEETLRGKSRLSLCVHSTDFRTGASLD